MFRRKRSDTRVDTLRKQYGEDFAPGFRGDAHLETVLKRMGADSLSQLLKTKGGPNMARKVFFSFHYDNDHWRAQQVRNIGAIEGNKPVSANDWEEVKKGGDSAIEKWIKEQLVGRSCTVVLVGAETANRKWVKHEIIESWNSNKGVFGIRIHSLKNSQASQGAAGPNPFDSIFLENGKSLSSIVHLYNFPTSSSTDVYEAISDNISDWIEKAVEIRDNY